METAPRQEDETKRDKRHRPLGGFRIGTNRESPFAATWEKAGLNKGEGDSKADYEHGPRI